VERPQLAFRIDHLHRVGVLIQQASENGRAVLVDDCCGARARANIRAGMSERALQFNRAPRDACARQIGTEESAVPLHTVAGHTPAFALEYGFPVDRITAQSRGLRCCDRARDRSQVRDDERRLRLRYVARRHGCTRNAVSNDGDQFLVGRPTTECPRRQVRPGNTIAVKAVTCRAARQKHLPAALDIGGRHPVILSGHFRSGDKAGRDCNCGNDDQHSARSHGRRNYSPSRSS
jgi:hypothetical protein